MVMSLPMTACASSMMLTIASKKMRLAFMVIIRWLSNYVGSAVIVDFPRFELYESKI